MNPQPYNPNGRRAQLDYQVEREPTLIGNGRISREQSGSVVAIEQREDEYLHATGEQSPTAERLPHGQAECAAAQLDIFNDSRETAE